MARRATRLAEWAELTGEQLPDALSDGRDDRELDETDDLGRRR